MSGRSPLTAEPAVTAVLEAIRQTIVAVTGSSLVGLYLFGSLTTGDFDATVSDLDVLAVLADAPRQRLAARLRRMHARLSREHPAWEDRIEVVYISAHGLATCRTQPTTIGVISPGEPFHVVEAGRDWILNWHPAHEHGIRLLGPPIASVIPPIPRAECLGEVRRSLLGFTARVPDDASPGWQAYAILTMCRGLSALRFGEPLSKPAAAAWARREWPQWAGLIGQALVWRQRQHDPACQDGSTTVAATRAFVADMAERART